jgi:prolyl oligopeptidase
MRYPVTRIENVIETIHGIKIKDPYRWLEDDNKEVTDWVDKQNEQVEQFIPQNLRKKLENKIKANFAFPTINAPNKKGELYFWTERQPDEQQMVLYVKKGLKGVKKELINPNKLTDKDKIFSLDFWYPSNEGKYLAYGLSEAGNELSQLKVMDVPSGKFLEDVAANAAWADVEWLPDSSGFYYTRNPEPGTVPEGEERLHQRVVYHKLGTSPRQDEVIFGGGRDKDDMYGLRFSADGRFLAISASKDWVKNDLFLYDCENKIMKDLITGYDGWLGLAFGLNSIYLYSNYQASNAKVLKAPLNNPPSKLEDWHEIVPEGPHKLEWLMVTKNKLLLTYLIKAAQKTLIFDHDGHQSGELPMPDHASLLSINCSNDEEEFFYEYASFNTPGITYRWDPATSRYELYHQMASKVKPEDYLVKQEWFTSKDGTKVPMSIVHHKKVKLDGDNPTLLYGYGGFEVSLKPGFLRGNIPWLEAGGIYASANIRGGGEFGKKWHTDGIKENKQKSYDDFIAAAEHLIKAGYTSPRRLAINGASNGGLLVNVAAIQRPDLFKAVLSGVPLADMVRFPNSLIAGRWVAEYGDPSYEEDLIRILKFSPYHNVKKGVKYPAFLLTTAQQDTRVHPYHARKMAAILQNSGSPNPVLLYTDKSTGHMGSLTMDSYYKKAALTFAFLAKQTGLKI